MSASERVMLLPEQNNGFIEDAWLSLGPKLRSSHWVQAEWCLLMFGAENVLTMSTNFFSGSYRRELTNERKVDHYPEHVLMARTGRHPTARVPSDRWFVFVVSRYRVSLRRLSYRIVNCST